MFRKKRKELEILKTPLFTAILSSNNYSIAVQRKKVKELRANGPF